MDSNLKELLSALNAYSAKYVVIGGYAVFIHAQPRMTKDLDVFIESSPANALATFKALAAFGAPLQNFKVEDFCKPTQVARFGNPPICIELLQQISGLTFSEVYARSEIVLVDGDLPVRYISADDLITNKLASGRPQDLADVAAIRQAQAATKRQT